MREAKIHQVVQLGDSYSTLRIDQSDVDNNTFNIDEPYDFEDAWSMARFIYSDYLQSQSQTPHGVAITLELMILRYGNEAERDEAYKALKGNEND